LLKNQKKRPILSNPIINKLIEKIKDQDLIKYFFLDLSLEELVNNLQNIKLTLTNNKALIPFDAQVKDYKASLDEEGNVWIIKKIEPNEVLIHKLQELAYYIDCELQTLAAPSILVKMENSFYRATKVVKKGTNISGYNYLVDPFKKVLTNDLINRWLFFDEDRNPNNYMVIHNQKNEPFIVAIDYNKADLLSEELKITGNDKEFGWFRQEKTRFLTLLKPSNFENLTIQNFNYRLNLLMNLSMDKIKEVAKIILTGYIPDPKEMSELVASNINIRRNYINDYFRKWFKEKNIEKKDDNSQYKSFGQAFLKSFENKK
jgi:hypothetical protein